MNWKRRSFFNYTISVLLMALFSSLLSNPAFAQTSLDLIVHYIEGKPVEGQFAYDVSVYFSLLDTNGNPIKDVTQENFSLSEDGQQRQINSLVAAEADPINVALVMDTSGSMNGVGIEAARKAASGFVSSLAASDRIAVISFNSEITTQIDFTTDQAAAINQVALIEATPGAGTCLYDAAYQAVQMSAALPPGRRAVILLTDGVDETPQGSVCSTYTIEDVISLASQGNTRVPIYTMGLGGNINAQDLERLANRTGGRYEFSPDASKLDAVFQSLSDQLRSQFLIHYTSTAAPGAHTLVLKANHLNTQDSDSRDFVLPALPLNLSIISPVSGQEISGKVNIVVNVSGQGKPIQQIVFKVNGESVGAVTTSPYTLEWDPTQVIKGNVIIEAIALDENGNPLASSSVSVIVPIEILPTVTSTPDLPDISKDLDPILQAGILLAGFLVVAGALFLLLKSFRKKKGEKERDKEWEDKVIGSSSGGIPVQMSDLTMDGFEPGEGALGGLVILQSDDPAMIGQRFEITRSVTTLGRKANNDIIFPKDSPVSRSHAVIEERNGQLYLSEVIATDDSGRAKRPSYGSFINGHQINAPVLLRNGDEIQLGKRLRIQFIGVNQYSEDTESTKDQILDSDATRD